MRTISFRCVDILELFNARTDGRRRVSTLRFSPERRISYFSVGSFSRGKYRSAKLSERIDIVPTRHDSLPWWQFRDTTWILHSLDVIQTRNEGSTNRKWDDQKKYLSFSRTIPTTSTRHRFLEHSSQNYFTSISLSFETDNELNWKFVNFVYTLYGFI